MNERIKMNIYFSKIAKRSEIQNLRSFLITGKECDKLNTESFKKRLDTAWGNIIRIIEDTSSETEENESLNEDIHNVINTYTNVFMELGLQCGMKLGSKIFLEGR